MGAGGGLRVDSLLKGRVVLVTGGAKRLGREIAATLAAAGARVVIHCHRSRVEAARLAGALRRRGGEAWVVQADLEDQAQVASLIDRSRALCGPVHMLVNSASIYPESRLADFDAQELARNVQVNAFAPLVLGRSLAREPGAMAIVNLLDCRITDHDPAHVAYLLSKRMLDTLTRMMALEFAPGVRVNAVAPGLILPPPGKTRSYLERMRGTNPLNAVGSARDVAAAVLFLLESKFITGQVVFVDGGRHLRGSVHG